MCHRRTTREFTAVLALCSHLLTAFSSVYSEQPPDSPRVVPVQSNHTGGWGHSFARPGTVQPVSAQRYPGVPLRSVSRAQFSESSEFVDPLMISTPISPSHQQVPPPPLPNFGVTDSDRGAGHVMSREQPGPIPVVAQKWSFNFYDAPWQTVIRGFAREAGLSLQMATEPEGTFTYLDDRLYSAGQFLDILNDYLIPGGVILVREDSRLTVISATSQIPDHLIPFVSVAGIDLLGRNELASVAIPLGSVDVNLAVEEIRQLQSSLGQVKPLSNSGRVIVTDTGTYLRRIRDLLLGSGIAAGDEHSLVFSLKHAQAEDVAKAITEFLDSVSSNSGDGNSASTGQRRASQRIVAEKTTNSLLLRGGVPEMATMQQIIADLDRAPREVLVQALLVEVELGNTNELGVELGFQDSVLFDRSVIDQLVTITQTTTAPNGTQTTNQNVISQTAAPGFNFNNAPLGNNVAASPSHVAGQGLSNFGVGRVNGDLGFGGLVLSAGSESVNVLLRALDAQFNVDILSRPQVRTVENSEAFIQIGQQVPVVDGVAITPVGSANPVIRQDQAGIILRVTPRISPDGRVQIAVNAEKSAFNLTPGRGVPIFTDATNGNVIEAPIKDITTAETTVSVQSGQTVVLGGMITSEQSVVARKVPWLGDIPLIGRLFRYDLNRHRRKELLVFLTPVVLDSDQKSELLKSREIERIRMPAEAWSFGDNLTGIYSDMSSFVTTPEFGPCPDGNCSDATSLSPRAGDSSPYSREIPIGSDPSIEYPMNGESRRGDPPGSINNVRRGSQVTPAGFRNDEPLSASGRVVMPPSHAGPTSSYRPSDASAAGYQENSQFGTRPSAQPPTPPTGGPASRPGAGGRPESRTADERSANGSGRWWNPLGKPSGNKR